MMNSLIPKSLSYLKVVIAVVFLTIIFGVTIGVAYAQTSNNSSTKADGGNGISNCYTIKLSLLKDNKPTNEVKVKVSQIKKYILEARIITSDSPMDSNGNPCPSGIYSLKYDIYNDASGTHSTPINSGYFDQNFRVSDKNFTKTYALTDPAKTTYTYSLIWTGGNRPPLTASINVTYTDDKGNVDPAGTPVTNANTKPSINVNTTVDAQLDDSLTKGLDTDLGSFFNPLQKDTLPELLATILRILFALIGIISVIIIIIAGFRMVLASGNEAELTKAKQAITWAIIGLIVALMSFSIVAIVQKLIQG